MGPAHDRVRVRRALREAEGYLELGMPLHALEILDRTDEPTSLKSHAQYLRGDALRALERYAEALEPLEKAAEMAPESVHVWLALGWCYKRSNRLDRAIAALEQADKAEPNTALVLYNLACYHSLAGQRREAMNYLSRALSIDAEFRDLVPSEADFDPIRSDPEFQALTSIIV